MNEHNTEELVLIHKKEDFENACYEAYKLRWMLAHGNTMSEFLGSVTELAGEAIEEDLFTMPTNHTELKELIDDSEEHFTDDIGFGGSLWACKDEFLNTEFTDVNYMHCLFDMMDNGYEMKSFYDKHYVTDTNGDNESLYFVTIKVDARFVAKVWAKDIEEAKKKAASECENAEPYELEYVDAGCVMVEDKDGNYLWEVGN